MPSKLALLQSKTLHYAGKTNRKGQHSTVDLLIKVACFVAKVNNVSGIKSYKLLYPSPMFAGKAIATQRKFLSGSPFLGKLLALPSNFRLGCKGLPGINTKANYKHL